MDDPIRDHIALARAVAQSERLRTSLERACWPGGGDRSEPAAAAWLRRWRPERIGAQMPACSCATGRCPVCN